MPHAEVECLMPKTSLFVEYEAPAYAYFPLDGVASVVAMTSDRNTVEVGFAGHEGVIGAYHLLGPAKVPTRCFVQIRDAFLRIPFSDLKAANGSSEEIRSRVLEFIQVDSLSVSQMAACNQIHDLETRLARSLLMATDRHKSYTLSVTHEILAEMIGARRSTVTVIAGGLQKKGLIRYSRGALEVLDPHGLDLVACHCYQVSKGLFNSLYEPMPAP
jgi:CRP-like cAMP-binding protein